MPRGRGVSLPFSITYNSNAVYHVIANPGNGFGEVVDNSSAYAAQGGWAYSVPTMNYSSWSVINQEEDLDCSYQSNYMFQDPAGGEHQLGMGYMQSLAGPGCKYSGLEYPTGGDSQVLSTLTGGLVVTDINGTTYNFDSSTTLPLPSVVTDRNGNQLNITNSGTGAFTVTDTLGRTLISSNGFGPSGHTNTLSTPQGNYQIAWTTATNSGFTLPNNKITSLSDSACTFPTQNGTRTVISSITLPNNKQYTVHYDPTYGLLYEIDYPTGGKVNYSWTLLGSTYFELAQFTASDGGACTYQYGIPVLSARQVSFTGSGTNLTQSFVPLTNQWTGDGTTWTTRGATVNTTDPILGSAKTTYTYSAYTEPNQPYPSSNFVNLIPVESQIQYFYWNKPSTPLRTITKGWYNQYTLECEFATLETGSSSGSFYQYTNPSYISQVSDHLEVDYGQIATPSSVCYNNAPWPASPTPIRETVTTYQGFTGPQYVSLGLGFAKPATVVIKGNGTKAAETDYTYDGQATSSVTAIHHDDTDYGTGFNSRGNATMVTEQCLGCTNNSVTTYTYDMTGQVLSKLDPCGQSNTLCSSSGGDMPGATSFTTQYSYADSFSIGTPPGNTNAYVTTVTLPTVNGVTAHEYYQYRYDDGQLTFSQDQNQYNAGSTVGTSYTYADSFHRLTQVNYPDGGETQYSYNDASYNPNTPSPSVTTTTAITSSLSEQNVDATDGIANPIETLLSSDPDGTTYTNTSYYGNGKPYKVYNPYRHTNDSTYGFTSYVYDGLGRKCLVVPPDVTSVPANCPTAAPAGDTFISYSGNCSTVTDEVGNSRTSCTDGLGRVTGVWEDPTSSNYETDYTYDALNNLLTVTQKGSNSANARVRTFQYDALSRLTSATNPESGNILYTYDVNGNVATRVAPQPNQMVPTVQTTTTYTYDALNRRLLVKHTNPSNANSAYAYDGTSISGCPGVAVPTISSPTNLIGRRSAMCSQQSASSFSYDTMGRLATEERTDGYLNPAPVTYKAGYQYYLDGSPETITYPSQNILTYVPGGAGRPLGVYDASNTYVSRATYAPQGALAGMANGNTSSFSGIITTNTYNDRLQPTLLDAAVPTISVSVSSGTYASCSTLPCTAVFSVSSTAGINVDDIVTVAGNSNSQLNGTFTAVAVASGQVTVNFETSGGGSGTGGTLTDDVSGSVFSLCYDFHLGQAVKSGPCNLTAYSTGDNGNVLQALNNVDSTRSAVFSYDRLNRITQANTINTTSANCWGEVYTIDAWGNLTNINPFTGMSGSCHYESLSAAPANTFNQLTGYSYDAAGNLLLNSSFYYDAENRLYNPSLPYTYFYDADGSRTRKVTSATVGTFYWPGANGEILTEANGSGTINEEYIYFNGQRIARVDQPTGTVHYYFSDHLGSASVVTNATGGSPTYDYYYPYGGLVGSSGSDPNHYLFTGKERDNDSGEFGLDYFGARHYGSMMGRFMSVDPAFESEILELPQSWNRYSYVYNRPIYGIDPDGRCPPCVGALVGGVIGGVLDLSKQVYNNGGSFSSVSWREVGAETLGGAVTGGLAVATGGTSLIESAAIKSVLAGATSAVVGGIVTRAAEGKDADEVLSGEDLSEDALAGFVGGLGGHVAEEFVHEPDYPVFKGRKWAKAVRRYNKAMKNYNGAVNKATALGAAGHATTGTFTRWLEELFFNQPLREEVKTKIIFISCGAGSGQNCQ